MNRNFYRCARCGSLLTTIENANTVPVCCGESMTRLTANTTDAAHEKHVPVYEIAGGAVRVRVGSATHPMTEAHYISWIALETTNGLRVCSLTPERAPEASFALAEGEEVLAVYAYCNLHGLWKA